jgi:hypothetical protein
MTFKDAWREDRAFEWLDKAVDARDWQVALLNIKPAFDSLRSDHASLRWSSASAFRDSHRFRDDRRVPPRGCYGATT